MMPFSFFFFFNDTATTEIYTLSLHDALPICFFLAAATSASERSARRTEQTSKKAMFRADRRVARSEEHTSELQSRLHLVCRLLLEKKKTRTNNAWSKTLLSQNGVTGDWPAVI